MMWERKSRYERKLSPGEVLFREGEKGGEMYLIRSGKLKLTRGEEDQEKLVAILKDGDFFGESALIDETPREFTATALEETSLVVIDREAFHTRIAENPLIHHIIEALTRRLRRAQEQVKYLKIRNDERRVLSLLLARAQMDGVVREEGVELLEEFGYENFAQVTGVEPAQVEEYFSRLERVGLIAIKGQRLVVRSIPDLEEYIEYVALREKFGGAQ